MKLLHIREWDNSRDTIGKLFYWDIDKVIKYIYILEDQARQIVVRGDTRISAGQYNITLRREGRVYESYCSHENLWIAENTQKYGILWIRSVPNFEYVLIHIGNDENDTEGCLLTGDIVNNNSYAKGYVSNSTEAYIKLCKAVFPAFDKKENVSISIIDDDKNIKEQMKNAKRYT